VIFLSLKDNPNYVLPIRVIEVAGPSRFHSHANDRGFDGIYPLTAAAS
jgi:hypothetical protein